MISFDANASHWHGAPRETGVLNIPRVCLTFQWCYCFKPSQVVGSGGALQFQTCRCQRQNGRAMNSRRAVSFTRPNHYEYHVEVYFRYLKQDLYQEHGTMLWVVLQVPTLPAKHTHPPLGSYHHSDVLVS